MIEIREVKTKKEQKQFINLYIKMYKGNKAWCPPLVVDEVRIFDKDYPYLDTAEAKYWLAFKDGKLVGRISAIWQKASNEKWGQKRVRFTRFDCIDDQEVADALFNTAEAWAKEQGLTEIAGPLGFNDLEREGLLVDGFEWLNTFEEQYNYPYYEKLILNHGFKQEVEWIEHRLFPRKEELDKVIRVGDMIEARGKLHVVPKMKFKKFVKEYRDQFFEIYDAGYEKLFGSVPFTQGMKKTIIENYALAINMNYLITAVDDDNNIKALAFCIPSLSAVLQKSNGHLYPWTIIKLLHTVRHPKRIDLGFVTCAPGENLEGGVALVYGKICQQIKKDKLEYVETNLNLTTNKDIIATWDHFDHITHKKRRSYVKTIE